jgi:nucleoside diphosphate kinase
LSLILIKPDAVERALTGIILHEFEISVGRLLRVETVRLTPHMVAGLYPHHMGKDYSNRIIESMVRGPSVAAWVDAQTWDVREKALAIRKRFMQSSNPAENIIHASEPSCQYREADVLGFPYPA